MGWNVDFIDRDAYLMNPVAYEGTEMKTEGGDRDSKQ